MRSFVILCLVSLAGCSYDPPVKGDRSSLAYQRSLKTCLAAAERAQGQREGTPSAAVGAIFDFHATEHRDVQTCMQGRGYALR